MREEQETDFIQRMPKVELHLHLEGAIQPATAIALMKRNKADHVPQSSAELARLYRFEDLTQFVTAMRTVTNHIQRPEDLQRIARELLRSLVDQNVRYVEFDVAVQKYMDLGFTLAEILDLLHECVQETAPQITARMIINLQRSHGAKKTAALVEQVAALNHPLVAGVGLSGDESLHPQQEFIEAFAIAVAAHLHRTVHAGEARGPESVCDALDLLHAERIDHGTRSIEDPDLVARLKREKIPLTQCLSSNLRLNVVPNLQAHPFPYYLREGLVVALHTDDPQIFQVSLTDEYRLAQKSFALTHEEMRQIVLNGVRGAFLPEEQKEEMRKRIEAEWESL
jgi:adenosine deaminase